MPTTEEPVVLPITQAKPESEIDPGYAVICWDDPINLMDYVTHVFQRVFGWTRERAEQHMMEVHNEGRSLLVRETLEKAEHFVHQLQSYNLQATMERGE